MSKFLFGEQELDSAVEALLNRSQECNGEVLYIGPVIRKQCRRIACAVCASGFNRKRFSWFFFFVQFSNPCGKGQSGK